MDEPWDTLSWLPAFREHTFRTVCLELPPEFREYMRQDGIVTGGPVPPSAIGGDSGDEEVSADEEQEQEQGQDFSSSESSMPHDRFPGLHQEIQNALKYFGGACMAKVGPSSAKDAVWITTENSLKCTTPSDIYELLKASDRVALALSSARTLTLKRWHVLEPSMEFRCFVHGGILRAICQRDDTVYYEHLEALRPKILRQVSEFIESVIKDRAEWRDFVVDLYLDGERVLIVDFGPWDERHTSGILIDWDELNHLASAEGGDTPVKFRVIESERDCRLGYARYNSVPVDLLDSAR